MCEEFYRPRACSGCWYNTVDVPGSRSNEIGTFETTPPSLDRGTGDLSRIPRPRAVGGQLDHDGILSVVMPSPW